MEPDAQTVAIEARPTKQPLPDRLGTYRLSRRLGQGGMGHVYEATDENLNRRAAVKVLPPDSSIGPEEFARLKREAQSSANLNHRNIVSVYAFGVERGFPYIAMELLDGRDLDKLLRDDGPLAPRDAVRMIIPAAEALSFAARGGIIHRDVKPSNIFLTTGGEIKVMDFGLAREMEMSSKLTASGVILGTPGFMSPEQIRGGHDLDSRCDIYSLGLTLYALVDGAPPHSTTTPMNAMIKLATEPLPIPDQWRVIAGGKFVRVLGKMTERDRADRYQTWSEAIKDLRDLAEALDRPETVWIAPTASPSSNGGMMIAAVAAAIAALAAGGGYFMLGGGVEAPGSSAASAPQGAISPEPPPAAGLRAPAVAQADAPAGAPISAPDPGAALKALVPASTPPPPRPQPQYQLPGNSENPALSNAARLADWSALLQTLPPSQAGAPTGGPDHAREMIETVQLARAFEAEHSLRSLDLTEAERGRRIGTALDVLDAKGETGSFEELYPALLYLTLLDAAETEEYTQKFVKRFPEAEHRQDYRLHNAARWFLHGRELLLEPPRPPQPAPGAERAERGGPPTRGERDGGDRPQRGGPPPPPPPDWLPGGGPPGGPPPLPGAPKPKIKKTPPV